MKNVQRLVGNEYEGERTDQPAHSSHGIKIVKKQLLWSNQNNGVGHICTGHVHESSMRSPAARAPTITVIAR